MKRLRTFEKIPLEVQRREGGRLNGCREAGPALGEGQGPGEAPAGPHHPVDVSTEHKHRLVLVWKAQTLVQFPHLKTKEADLTDRDGVEQALAVGRPTFDPGLRDL